MATSERTEGASQLLIIRMRCRKYILHSFEETCNLFFNISRHDAQSPPKGCKAKQQSLQRKAKALLRCEAIDSTHNAKIINYYQRQRYTTKRIEPIESIAQLVVHNGMSTHHCPRQTIAQHLECADHLKRQKMEGKNQERAIANIQECALYINRMLSDNHRQGMEHNESTNCR